MIAVNRLANGHEPTRAYVRKRTGGDKADLDTLRRIKRYIAREVSPCSATPSPTVPTHCPGLLDSYRRFGSAAVHSGDYWVDRHRWDASGDAVFRRCADPLSPHPKGRGDGVPQRR
jgi:hypothetical protein